jgi:integral membrane protein (TIGR01906 family)
MAAAQGTTSAEAATARAGSWRRVAVFAGTCATIVALAVLPLLTPAFTHPALDASASAERLVVEAGTARELSDRSVAELVLGPGTFEFAGPDGSPFYDADERAHLADARALLWLCLLVGLGAAVATSVLLRVAPPFARASLWRALASAGAVSALVVLVLGLVSLLAFDSLFEAFHRLAFPGGNWAFDPTAQRLVQLYPFRFWQLASAGFGALVLLLGAGAWQLGRTMARRTEGRLAGAEHRHGPGPRLQGT